MDRKKILIGGLAVGAAYLLKDKNARQKLMNQFQSFTNKTGQNKA
jgi:hypothetical protein